MQRNLICFQAHQEINHDLAAESHHVGPDILFRIGSRFGALRSLLAAAVIAAAQYWVLAQNGTVPGQINYQGYLTDANGIPLGNGHPTNYLVQFRIYNSPTTTSVLWGEQQVVTVDRGYFTVLLGAGASDGSADHHTNDLTGLFNAPDASSRFIGITVQGLGTTKEIQPRLQFLAAPYALQAANAVQVGGQSPDSDGVANTLVRRDATGSFSANSIALSNSYALTINQFMALYIDGSNNSYAGGSGNRSTTGVYNTALGIKALATNSTGRDNTAIGVDALLSNTTGGWNTAIGVDALDHVISGNSNVALGFNAGINLTNNDSNNIDIGNAGMAGDSGIVRIGTSGTHTQTLLTGYVGIGTTNSPGALLDVAGAMQVGSNGTIESPGSKNSYNGMIEVYWGDNDRYGLGELTNGATTLYTSANWPQSSIQFGQMTGSSSFSPQMTIFHNGNVSIGLQDSATARLSVYGGGNYITNEALNYIDLKNSTPHQQIDLLDANTPLTPSIYAQNGVVAGGVYSTSDRRMKNVVGSSNGASDLKTLMGIEITDYTYKDRVAHDNRPHKKVIAQQVESVFPQAVSRITDVVPDIFHKAQMKEGWVCLATDLRVGDRVKLIGENESGIYEVLETREEAFRTAFKTATDTIFVYGREVKDFRSVDYDAISMLNVSATQELARKLAAAEAELAKIRAEKEALADQVATLEAREQAHEARLARLESRLNAGGLNVRASLNPK